MQPLSLKPLAFVGRSLKDLRTFPEDARQEAGFQLHQLQVGHTPSDYKRMRTVGKGVYEIRIHTEGQAHRVFYVAKFEEAIYVLHAFEKKTPRTSPRDIAIGQARYKLLVSEREEED